MDLRQTSKQQKKGGASRPFFLFSFFPPPRYWVGSAVAVEQQCNEVAKAAEYERASVGMKCRSRVVELLRNAKAQGGGGGGTTTRRSRTFARNALLLLHDLNHKLSDLWLLVAIKRTLSASTCGRLNRLKRYSMRKQ